MGRTQNPKILEAVEHMHEARLALGRAELALQRAGESRLGLPVILLNNLAGMVNNVASNVLYQDEVGTHG